LLRALRVWHRRHVIGEVDQPAVLVRVQQEAGWSTRYAFMVVMSAGIAILGLLLSSPAVIIGAMLISPLMGPIIGLGFALATFDWPVVRRSLIALALGTVLAVGFSALMVHASPLQDNTTEILARTRPNLFDLLVAIFSALAGGYATVRGRGETIVGVAIATALMPPLAVVGYGLATANMPVFLGAGALYVTNFIAIALSAAAMARFYGFGARLTPRQSRQQGLALVLVLLALAVPLAFSLKQIAWEAWATRTARNAVQAEFGPGSRVASFDPSFGGDRINIRATVLTDRLRERAGADLEAELSRTLQQPVRLALSQILVNDGSQRADLERARLAVQEARADRLAQADLATRLAYMTGADPDAITIDAMARRAVVRIGPDQDLASVAKVEARARAVDPLWDIRLIPPLQPLPPIRFAAGSAAADTAVQEQLRLHLWALDRWGVRQVDLAGGRHSGEPARLATDRVASLRPLLESCGIMVQPVASLAIDRAAEADLGQAQARIVRVSPALEASGLQPGAQTEADADPAPCIAADPTRQPQPADEADAQATAGERSTAAG
jgi:uncharacterized hydrophobic protein (TIGR00271 family)